jgi:uncharacterized protein
MIGTIDVRDLVGHPGATKVEQVAGTVEDLATELAGVPEDAPIRGELVLESLLEGILAVGRLEGSLALRCARCLTEFERGFSVELQELFVPFPHEDGDEYPLDPEGFLEPDQMVRDVIGVELPFAPVCRPDCRGLCSRCGGDLNLGECICEEPQIDPRWEGLDVLLEELGSSERVRPGTRSHDQARTNDQARSERAPSDQEG